MSPTHLYHPSQVERLASGLSHEPRVVVARLNALGSSEAFMFSTGALEVKQYPTIFLYPEGSPGYMRFTGAEDGMWDEGMKVWASQGTSTSQFGRLKCEIFNYQVPVHEQQVGQAVTCTQHFAAATALQGQMRQPKACCPPSTPATGRCWAAASSWPCQQRPPPTLHTQPPPLQHPAQAQPWAGHQWWQGGKLCRAFRSSSRC